MAVSPRLGRNSQKEQYAIFYKAARAQLQVRKCGTDFLTCFINFIQAGVLYVLRKITKEFLNKVSLLSIKVY